MPSRAGLSRPDDDLTNFPAAKAINDFRPSPFRGNSESVVLGACFNISSWQRIVVEDNGREKNGRENSDCF